MKIKEKINKKSYNKDIFFTRSDLNKIKRSLRKSVDNYKNENYYEELEREIQYNRQHSM